MHGDKPARRTVLATVGTLCSGALAGCSGSDTTNPEGGDNEETADSQESNSESGNGQSGSNGEDESTTKDGTDTEFSTEGDDSTLIDKSDLQVLSPSELPAVGDNWEVTDKETGDNTNKGRLFSRDFERRVNNDQGGEIRIQLWHNQSVSEAKSEYSEMLKNVPTSDRSINIAVESHFMQVDKGNASVTYMFFRDANVLAAITVAMGNVDSTFKEAARIAVKQHQKLR